MSENPFDDLPDMTPSGTIKRTLPHAYVHSDKPLVLEMKHASVVWNKAFADMRTALAADFDKAYGTRDETALRKANAALFAATVIVGWEECNGKDGQPLAYTPELACLLIAEIESKGLKDQVDFAFNSAGRTDNFRTSPAAAVAALGK